LHDVGQNEKKTSEDLSCCFDEYTDLKDFFHKKPWEGYSQDMNAFYLVKQENLRSENFVLKILSLFTSDSFIADYSLIHINKELLFNQRDDYNLTLMEMNKIHDYTNLGHLYVEGAVHHRINTYSEEEYLSMLYAMDMFEGYYVYFSQEEYSIDNIDGVDCVILTDQDYGNSGYIMQEYLYNLEEVKRTKGSNFTVWYKKIDPKKNAYCIYAENDGEFFAVSKLDF